ncbi:MAG: hypothetical protein KF798_05980 [Candidatus Paracaedibacteraceae bacterium]|nr:hypothetical protein [Candidatus Paracaedibacteraceae bacterium]
MKIKTILYTTLLCSTVFSAEHFDPNALTGSTRAQIAQLHTYLQNNGVTVVPGESVNSLKQKAVSFIASQNREADAAQAIAQQIATLTGERDTARTEKVQLETQLTALQARQGQAVGDAQALTQRIELLKGERDYFQAKSERSKTKTQTLRAEKTQLETQLTALQEQQNQAVGDVQALTQRIELLKGEREAARAEKDRLETQLTALTQRIELLKGEREAARTEKDRLETQLAALQAQQGQAAGDAQAIAQQIAALTGERDTARTEKDQLEVRHQGDLLLITQLQEQVSRLQEAQHAGFSAPRVVPEQQASENTLQPPLGAPPPPPPMPIVREDSAAEPKPGKKQANSETQTSSSTQQRLSAADLTTARLKPKDEQTPLAASKAPKLTLLDQIRGRGTHKPKSPLSADEQIKLAQIKKEITEGKYVSIFWKPEESASTQNTSSEAPSMFDAIKSAMDKRRAGVIESNDDTSSDNSDWSDSDDDTSLPAVSPQPDVPTKVLKQLSTIRQIYREALEIGYEDEAKTTKWTTDRWLLWEYEFYKTARQKFSVDEKIGIYIRDNINDLQNRFRTVNFESIVHKDGVPMATHSTGDGQDPLLQSVVFPSK